MLGTVLEFQITSNAGVVSGEDGQHYQFLGSAWRGGNVAPKTGDRVDFAPGEPTPEGRATAYSVFPAVSTAAPAASAKLFSTRWRWATLIMAVVGLTTGTVKALDDYFYSTSGALVYGVMNGLFWVVIVLGLWALVQGILWIRRRVTTAASTSAANETTG